MATVDYAAGSTASGLGKGGSGGGGKKPSNNTPKKGSGKKSEREKQLDAVVQAKQWIQDNLISKTSIGKKDLTQGFLQGIINAINVLGTDGFNGLTHKPNKQWTTKLLDQPPGSAYDLNHAPDVSPGFSLTPGGGQIYIPAILASAARGQVKHEGNNQCTRCINGGTGPWEGCQTLQGMFNGACFNCCYGNHYERCSFSSTFSGAGRRRPSTLGTPRRVVSSPESTASPASPTPARATLPIITPGTTGGQPATGIPFTARINVIIDRNASLAEQQRQLQNQLRALIENFGAATYSME